MGAASSSVEWALQDRSAASKTGIWSAIPIPAESPRGCIIATTQMFGLVSKDKKDFKDSFHALFIASRQAIALDPS